MKKRIPFGVWEPDSGAVTGLGRATKAVNVVPVRGGYKSIFGWDVMEGSGAAFTVTPISASNVIGAISVRDNNNFPNDIIATTTSVYYLAGTGFTAPVITGAAATAQPFAGSYYRDFAQYGQELYMASGLSASQTSPICYSSISSAPTAMTAIPSGFQARVVTTLRDFVVWGNTYDSTDGEREYRIRWSAFGNGQDYVPSAATQSDFQDLVQEFGPIRRILGGNDVFVVCERGVVLMEYVGGATIMRFTYIQKVGSGYPQSCIRVDDYVYMYSSAGFVRVGKAPGDVSYIGKGRVDKEFDYLLNDRVLPTPPIRAYHDELNRGVGWQYNDTDGSAFFYSYAEDQWTVHGTSADRAGAYFMYSSGLSYPSGLYPVPSSRFKTAAAIGGDGKPYAQNDRTNKAKYELATGFEEMTPGRKSIIDKVWPVYDIRGAAPTNPELVVTSIPKLAGVNLYSEPTSTYSSTAAVQSDGFFTVTGPGGYEGRYHRFQLENSDTASERTGEQAILGLDVEYFERGNY